MPLPLFPCFYISSSVFVIPVVAADAYATVSAFISTFTSVFAFASVSAFAFISAFASISALASVSAFPPSLPPFVFSSASASHFYNFSSSSLVICHRIFITHLPYRAHYHHSTAVSHLNLRCFAS